MRSWLQLVACVPILLFAACGSKDPEVQKRELVASGDRYAAQQKYPEAIIQYRTAIAIDPRFGEARLKLATAYQKSDNIGNAYREYIRAADLMPDNVDAQLKAGTILLLNQMYPEARSRANAALEKDPKNASALILLGNALAGLRDIDGAITRVEDAIDKDPQMTLAYANLGWLQAGKGDVKAAEGAFKKALEINNNSQAARLNLANFYWAARRVSDAEREMKAVVAAEPNSVEANQLLAAFYINGGQRAAGEPYLKKFASLSPRVEAKLTLADFYLADGRNAEAATVLEPLKKTPEGFAAATLRLAVIHFNAGQKPQAYGEVEEVLKKTPADELALFVKTRFLIAEKRFQEALPIADAAIKNNPKAVRMHYMRAASLRALGRRDESIATMKTALQLLPSSTVGQGFLAELYLDKQDGTAALDLATQVAKAQPKSVAAHYLLARALLESGNVDAAEREFLALSGSDLDEATRQTWLGRTYLEKNDKAKARRAFERANQLAPDSLLALNGLVTVDVLDANNTAANTRLEAQIAKDPKNVSLLFMGANTYMTTGNPQRAEALFLEVLRLAPDNFDTYRRLGTLYAETGRLDEAKAKFISATQNQEKPVAALTFLGIVLQLQNNPQEAQKQYEKALALNPRAAVAANNLAWMYAERGENLDTALQLAQTAKSAVPDNASISNTLGWVYFKKGLFPQAVTALKESADRSPTDPAKRYYLGLAYLKANQPMQARRALEDALKLNPRFPQAEDARQTLAGIKG